MKRLSVILAFVLLLLLVAAMMLGSAVAKAATADDPHYVMKVLVRGAPIHQANGIWAACGRLYVGSVVGQEIVVLDARTGRIIDRLTRAKGYGGADDVTMGPDGSLYWTDLLEGKVGRRAPDGTITWQSVGLGVNPIIFDKDGRLFVAQAIMPAGDALWELDPALQADPKLVWDPGDGYPFLQQLNGFDFGPDGMLYAPQPFLGTVVRLDLTADPITPQVIASGLTFPTGVEFDSRGHLYAVQSADQGEVLRIDVATGKKHLVARVPTGMSGLDNLAFDACDRLFVTGAADGSVWRILRCGHPRNLSRGGVNTPGGIVAMPRSCRSHRISLCVADVFSLYRFDARTGHVKDVQFQSFEGAGGLTMPFTAGPFGSDLALTSYFGGTVQLWDPDTNASLGIWTDIPTPLNAIGFGEDLIVASLGAEGAQVIRQDPGGGRTVFPTPMDPQDPQKPLFYLPTGLAATGDDLWVADWATGIVWQLVEDNVTLASPRLVTYGLAGPEGLAVDRDGSLLVVEEGKECLTRIDPATGATSPVASGLALAIGTSPSYLPFGYVTGVTVDRCGNIYVTGMRDGVIYRLMHIPCAR